MSDNEKCFICEKTLGASNETHDMQGETVCTPCLNQNAKKCSECSTYFDKESAEERGKHGQLVVMCPDCAENFITCDNCGAVEKSDESHTHNDETFCENCFNDNYGMCEKCNETFANDDLQYVDLGRVANGSYCADCFNDKFFSCHSCNETFSNDDSCSAPDDNSYCSDCWGESFTTCEGCNESFYNDSDQLHNTENGTYCNDCHAPFEFRTSKTFEKNTSKRFVGVEIEFISRQSSPDVSKWGILQGDGSLSATKDNSGNGEEFASHAYNGDKLLNMLDGVTKVLNESDTYINKTCGLHVHLDLQHESKEARENIYHAFQACEKIFFAMTAISRRGNTYCKSINDPYYMTLADALHGDRYRTLNASAFNEHKTFEIRLHQGTCEANKLKAWVMLLINFFDTFSKVRFTIDKVREVQAMTDRAQLLFLFQQVKCSLSLKKYLVKRIRHFNKEGLTERMPQPFFALPLGKVDAKQLELMPNVETMISTERRPDNDSVTVRRTTRDRDTGQVIQHIAENFSYDQIAEALRGCQCSNCGNLYRLTHDAITNAGIPWQAQIFPNILSVARGESMARIEAERARGQ